jgi:hypothetical protein
MRAAVTLGVVGVVAVSLVLMLIKQESSAVVLLAAPAPLAKPPENQTYIGAKQCQACHFDQFLAWRQTKHAKAFEILPAKYKADASCLKCHTTGHGQATGYSGPKTPDLVGTSCEACHGPGSEHAKIAKTYAGKKLAKDEEAYVRSTTHKILPGNACIACHMGQAHKKHPPYDK